MLSVYYNMLLVRLWCKWLGLAGWKGSRSDLVEKQDEKRENSQPSAENAQPEHWKISQSEKGAEELKTLVYGLPGLQEIQLLLWAWPTGDERVNAVLALMEGEEAAGGCWAWHRASSLPTPSSSGAAGSLHCWAAVVLWLPKEPWETESQK